MSAATAALPAVTHTPGPWNVGITHVNENGEGLIGVWVDDKTSPIGFRSIACINFSKMNLDGRWPTDMPDARLIMAAPDLLAALDSLLNMLPSATAHPAIQAARAAIAKATGQ